MQRKCKYETAGQRTKMANKMGKHIVVSYPPLVWSHQMVAKEGWYDLELVDAEDLFVPSSKM